MSFIDSAETMALRAKEDYFIRAAQKKAVYDLIIPMSFKDVKIVEKGQMYEVLKIDWKMYKLGVLPQNFDFHVRKVGNKKSFKVKTLYFLEEE